MSDLIAPINSENGRILIGWLREFSYFSDKVIEIVVNTEELLRIKIYTNDNSYQIVAKKHYLGCQASTRKQRPGETHTRGSDLPDGVFNRRILVRIMGAIVGYELKEIAVPQEPKVRPPATEEAVQSPA